jgi:hypothetical protein
MYEMKSKLKITKSICFIKTFLIFFFFSISVQAEVFPTLMNSPQRKEVAPFFSTAYSQMMTTRPYFIGNYPGLEIGASVTYKGLSEIQQDFPSDQLRDELILTQLFIKKSLVHRLEITFSSTLSSFGTSQVSGFGGMLSWHPLDLNDFKFSPALSIFTNYMNYEDSLTYQDSGLLLSVGQNFKKFSLNTGISLSQMNARFSGSSAGRQITSSGDTETEKLFLQTVFISLITNYENYFLSLVQNYNFESGFEPGLIVSYQF